MHQQQTTFENIVGKGEIAHNEQFFLFPQCFLLNQLVAFPFVHTFDTITFFAAELEELKIGVSSKQLQTNIPKHLQIDSICRLHMDYLAETMVFFVGRNKKQCGRAKEENAVAIN